MTNRKRLSAKERRQYIEEIFAQYEELHSFRPLMLQEMEYQQIVDLFPSTINRKAKKDIELCTI